MLRYLMAASAMALLASGAPAQMQAGSHNPAVKNGAPHRVAAPAEGANSFTEDQARGRLKKAGYVVSSRLTKQNGLWRGMATKGGKRVPVMLDYKGNIATR